MLAASALLVAPLVRAQRPPFVARIGFLALSDPRTLANYVDAFRQVLGALGYVEGRNLAIEYRYAAGLRAPD